MTKERPILFSTPMVQAILQGRKTMTRRVVKHHQVNGTPGEYSGRTLLNIKINGKPVKEYGALFQHATYPEIVKWVKCPYGQPGDVLWVRETWGIEKRKEKRIVFKARMNDYPIQDDRWRPSIHMPKAAARIWLRITDVRVERLHDISEADAIAEGIETSYSGLFFKNYQPKPTAWGDGSLVSEPEHSFKSLWQTINGEESWLQNPWVWVVKFEVLSTTGRKEAKP